MPAYPVYMRRVVNDRRLDPVQGQGRGGIDESPLPLHASVPICCSGKQFSKVHTKNTGGGWG